MSGKIVAAAMLTPDDKLWWIPAPNRHGHIMQSMTSAGVDVDHIANSIEGFIDKDCKFLNRFDAMARVLEIGQSMKPRGEGDYQGPELFSEDLW
jgi:hypothetical protein